MQAGAWMGDHVCMEERMRKNRLDEQFATKAPSALPAERSAVRWPWGVVALAVIALGWVGVYLLWNGVVFLTQL